MALVGIVANVSNAGLGAPADDSVFRPFAQQPWMSAYLVVRTDNDPRRLAASLRRTIAIADPAAVPGAIVPLDRIVADEAAQPAFRTILLASLAALAIAIAVVGLYGAISYAVSQRTREIGIRVALGATSGAVQRAVVGDGMAVAAAGIAIGTAGALAMARLLTGLLFGVTPADPVSYAGAAIGLLVLSIVAAYIPARRAARVDPTEALRHE
jgi:putative ABC transport system permease protein